MSVKRAANRFSRWNQPVACRQCGKLTTYCESQGIIGVDLCRPCLEQAEMDNAHYDGYHEDAPNADCNLCVRHRESMVTQ